MRGFGLTFDVATGACRNWYIDAEGAKRWADNDELVMGFNGQHDTEPHDAGRGEG